MEGAEKWYWLGERILGMEKKRREPLEKENCKKKNHPKIKHAAKP